MIHIIIEGILAYAATVGFGIILNIPRHALNVAGWIGAAGWAVYELIVLRSGAQIPLAQMAIGMLTAGLLIGVLSNWAARVKHMPVILFNIPSLVPLVPGGQAYQVIRNLVTGHGTIALDYLGQVIAIAGMIALGFLLSELLVRITYRLRHTLKTK
ncbi:threonine/serine exporter family protein [Furfurilactobacillus rossiae]|uniref:Integral membrane protein n=1 Tax=Furfurilactobacillus rossiae DSM 15814 TaxID=1114972 RepID=A0A0R1RIA2_9LACO|nr:threonine/serine exporter family protein [Furfurilactobacillus rossiae]KRL53957.1 integral membrane protein [Furfurilactobacillus rossiae DSM 15814]MCF6164536.1 threonine/serine exporter family protein [Furfurilactobacillus rossiae]QFR66626.1 threonine/serine exporter [Furfurilactobacillus rossiae]QLE62100.1 Integral membrane protein [Furfurilactobacillus rossiae]QLE64819.1 Integral membrane protein [Furfurilactobacillus rossiae]